MPGRVVMGAPKSIREKKKTFTFLKVDVKSVWLISNKVNFSLSEQRSK
jgi:hypothetical protein